MTSFTSAAQLVTALKKAANPKLAAFQMGFFKTAPRQYGHGDRFLGLKVPTTRSLAKRAQDLPPSEISKLLQSPWHEARLAGLVILNHKSLRAKTDVEIARLAKFYWSERKGVNNWDLVDVSAHIVLGRSLLREFEKNPTTVRAWTSRWAKSRILWERRLAVLANFGLVRAGHFDTMILACEILLKDDHDLIHKATGWMLREIGKRSPAELRNFLKRHAHHMPRTMLRYSIEKLSPAERARWMNR